MAVKSAEVILTDEAEAMRAYDSVDVIGFDLETTGLHCIRNRPAVVAFAAAGLPPVSLHYPYDGIPMHVIEWLNKKRLVGHNITAFDIPFLKSWGFDAERAPTWFDTMTAEQLIMQSDKGDVKKNVKATIKRRLGVEIAKDLGYHSWAQPELTDEQLRYVAEDIMYLLPVMDKQLKSINEEELDDAWDIEQSIAPVVSSMVWEGMPLDNEARTTFLTAAGEKLDEIYSELDELLGTRAINSPKKIIEAFRTELGVDLKSTRDDIMQTYEGQPGAVGKAAALVRSARRYRKRFMYDDDWCEKYVVNGRVHASYKTQAVETGRFSSSDPNIQQTPRDMRMIYGHPEGSGITIIKADYAQIEVLASAVLMKENVLINWIREGVDIHTRVASMIYNKDDADVTKDERRIAKAGSFTLLFAGGAGSLIATAREGGYELTREEAQEVIQKFFEALPNAHKFINRMYAKADNAKRTNASVNLRIPGGPRRSLTAKNVTGSTIVNTIVQGSAAVGLKRSLVYMRKEGIAKYVRATIHDEIVLEVPDALVSEVSELVIKCMKRGMYDTFGIEPGVELEYGSHWS